MSRKVPLFCNNWNLSRTGRTAKEVTAAFGEDLKLNYWPAKYASQRATGGFTYCAGLCVSATSALAVLT